MLTSRVMLFWLKYGVLMYHVVWTCSTVLNSKQVRKLFRQF